MAAAKKKRVVFDLKPNRYSFETGSRTMSRWNLQQRGRETLTDSDRQKTPLRLRAIALCRKIHAEGGTAQLVIHDMHGKIQTEHTYGADPRRTKG